MSQRNRAKAEATLEWSNMTNRYLSIYQGIETHAPAPALVAEPSVTML
jgi:hypothetical protein